MSAEFEDSSALVTEEQGMRLLQTINRVARGARRYRLSDRDDFVAEVSGRAALKVLRRASVSEVRSLDALAIVAVGTISTDLWRSWCRRRGETSMDDGEHGVPEPRDRSRTPEEALTARNNAGRDGATVERAFARRADAQDGHRGGPQRHGDRGQGGHVAGLCSPGHEASA